uniref:Lipid droplet-associated hydrolase n=1 Tax=Panagrolaimus superbus TaxID=310955 RepID=A0A914Y7E6_9BILA
MKIEKFTTWIKVSRKYTRITWQRNFTPKQNQEAEIIFVMIPGNPGNDKFYDHFGERILEVMADNQFHIPTEFYSISHLNHVELPNHLRDESDIKHDDLFLLNDQITHKFNYFMEYMPKKTPIILMGHSIGSYMALKILPQLIENGFNVVKVLGLFPTIEQMALSPNGVRVGGALAFFDNHATLTKILLSWLWLLPDFFKRFIIRLKFRDPLVPECVVQSAMEIVSSSVVRNIMHLANNELQIVKLHDDSLFLNEHRDRILLYYGTTDQWVPAQLAEEQAARLGRSCVFLDNDGCEHAFVIRDGEVMARTVVSLIEQFLKT